MSANSAIFSSLAKAGGALGKGLIAGLAGTLVMTAAQMIEMKISNRSMSSMPAKVGGKALGVEPKGKAELEKEKAASENDQAPEKLKKKVKANKKKFNMMMHLSYGTSWGLFRGALDLAGLQGVPASLVHFGAVWGTAQVMLPATTKTKAIINWSPKQIATDVLFHAVYTCAAGLVYDAMNKAEKRNRRFRIF